MDFPRCPDTRRLRYRADRQGALQPERLPLPPRVGGIRSPLLAERSDGTDPTAPVRPRLPAQRRHGKYEKHSFFDPEIRVPLLIRLPGGERRRIGEIVELLDLAPTLLELTGVEPEPEAALDGASLCGLLRGDSGAWKNRAFCENYWPARTERDGAELPEDYGRALIRDGFKCCLGGNMPEPNSLFDLANDPNELNNLWHDPKQSQVRDEMVATIHTDWHRIAEPEKR